MHTIIIPKDFEEHTIIEFAFWDFEGSFENADLWMHGVSDQLQAMLWNWA